MVPEEHEEKQILDTLKAIELLLPMLTHSKSSEKMKRAFRRFRKKINTHEVNRIFFEPITKEEKARIVLVSKIIEKLRKKAKKCEQIECCCTNPSLKIFSSCCPIHHKNPMPCFSKNQ